MISIITGVFARIISNSYINFFQKILTNKGSKPSIVNFYTYFGLFLVCVLFFPLLNFNFSKTVLINFMLMGLLGALGNYFIIKALSIGELSSLAPINSYKPIVAMVIAFLYLGEVPSLDAILGILLIIGGTYILHKGGSCNGLAVFYRVLALIFSGTEAVFIKKIILLTNIPASFLLWVTAGLIFSSFFMFISKHKPELPPVRDLSLLILSVGIMQFSTNFVFAKMNVSYALALFQLSTILSVFLGVNVFHESGLKRKIISSIIMIAGAVVIILQ